MNQFNCSDAEALGSAYFGQGISNRPIFFTDSQCTGLEDNITDCHNSQNTIMCMPSMGAGVKCAGTCGSMSNAELNQEFHWMLQCQLPNTVIKCYYVSL